MYYMRWLCARSMRLYARISGNIAPQSSPVTSWRLRVVLTWMRVTTHTLVLTASLDTFMVPRILRATKTGQDYLQISPTGDLLNVSPLPPKRKIERVDPIPRATTKTGQDYLQISPIGDLLNVGPLPPKRRIERVEASSGIDERKPLI